MESWMQWKLFALAVCMLLLDVAGHLQPALTQRQLTRQQFVTRGRGMVPDQARLRRDLLHTLQEAPSATMRPAAAEASQIASLEKWFDSDVTSSTLSEQLLNSTTKKAAPDAALYNFAADETNVAVLDYINRQIADAAGPSHVAAPNAGRSVSGIGASSVTLASSEISKEDTTAAQAGVSNSSGLHPEAISDTSRVVEHLKLVRNAMLDQKESEEAAKQTRQVHLEMPRSSSSLGTPPSSLRASPTELKTVNMSKPHAAPAQLDRHGEPSTIFGMPKVLVASVLALMGFACFVATIPSILAIAKKRRPAPLPRDS